MDRPRSSALLTTIVFVSLIAAPVLSLSYGVSETEIENRSLTDFPRITASSLVDPNFYLQIRGYLSDRLPARTAMIRMGASVDYWLFGQSASPQRVVRGRDRWLYLVSTFDEACDAIHTPGAVVSNMRAIAQLAEMNGKTLRIVPMPDKRTVYPEYLTSALAELSTCLEFRTDELRSMLTGEEWFVDTWDLMRTARGDIDANLYFRDDSHPTPVGSTVWIEELVESIDPTIEASSSFVPAGPREHVGNLVKTMGLTFSESVNWVEENGRSGFDMVANFGEDLGATWGFERYRSDDAVPGEARISRALLLKDSMLDLPHDLLIPFFDDLTMIDWRDGEALEFMRLAVTDADVIILETAEHEMWERFADSELVEALSTVLP